MTITESDHYKAAEQVRIELNAKQEAHRREKFLRVMTAVGSLLLTGAALYFWAAPLFRGGAK